MLQLRASSLADTHAIAGAIAGLARPGDMLILSGDMGAGKTAFAQGFGWALGVTEPITSPTFTLVHSYECGKLTLHHADLYRLERTTEIAELALPELAEFDGIVLVEWGDVVDDGFGDHLVVHLEQELDDLDLDLDGGSDGGGGDELDLDGGVDGGVDDLDLDDDGRTVDRRTGRRDGDVVPADGARLIELVGVGASWAARWPQLVERCGAFRC